MKISKSKLRSSIHPLDFVQGYRELVPTLADIGGEVGYTLDSLSVNMAFTRS